MPRDDDYSELAPPTTADSEFLSDLLFDDNGDPHAQELFDQFMLDPDASEEDKDQAFEELCDYLWGTYGIDFEEMFDWEDFKEWYD
jgi:hypothetical protein